jgi:CheY-like chemotaxis protein
MHISENQSPLRILIVDDNADHANSLSTMLAIRGYDVQSAYSSAKAIEQAAARKPDVAILDLGLPEMDGYELATKLRASHSDVVLLAVSAHVGDAYQEKARAVGMEHYFVKPVAIAKLCDVLGQPSGFKAAPSTTSHSSPR